MKLNYKSEDHLYEQETGEYVFNYKTSHGQTYAAHIKLTKSTGDHSYNYDIILDDHHGIIIDGQLIKELSSLDFAFYHSAGLIKDKYSYHPNFRNEDEALQHAIDTIYVLLDKNEGK